MTKYSITFTTQFKKDFKRVTKRGLDEKRVLRIIETLAEGEPLPSKHRDHALTGNWAGFRECHIQPDWLLIYLIEEETLSLACIRTGSHSDLF